MTRLDRLLQNWRITVAMRFIPRDSAILDVGCGDGALFQHLGPALGRGFGIDPTLLQAHYGSNFQLTPGRFPDNWPANKGMCDVITLLAVVEHIPRTEQPAFVSKCIEILKPGGRIVVTVPSAPVDAILWVLRLLRLVHGMSVEQHYGFSPKEVCRLFGSQRVKLIHRTRFQLGLNNLFVFQRVN